VTLRVRRDQPVRVSCASQFAADVAPTEAPTAIRSAWASRRSCSCATCAASSVTETRVDPSSSGGIDHNGVPATDPSSARTDATTADTGCEESAAAVMHPANAAPPTPTD